MQNPAFIHRWAPVALVAAAIVCQAAAFPANAAAMSNPAAAAIAAAGASPATAQPAPIAVAQPPATSGASSPSPVTSGAPAGEVAQAPRHTDAPELAALQAQIALWKARAEIAKYKAEVKRAEDSLTAAAAAPSGGAPAISLAAPMPAGPAIGDRVKGLSQEAPRLVSLRAFDGHFNAIVDLDGRTVPVQPGDALEGGWKVVSIDDGGVKLANGKRVRTLRP